MTPRPSARRPSTLKYSTATSGRARSPALYKALDASVCLALYTPDAIRVKAEPNWLGGLEEYADRIRVAFAELSGAGFTVGLHLTFQERLISSALASERGAFRLVGYRGDIDQDEVIASGRFWLAKPAACGESPLTTTAPRTAPSQRTDSEVAPDSGGVMRWLRLCRVQLL